MNNYITGKPETMGQHSPNDEFVVVPTDRPYSHASASLKWVLKGSRFLLPTVAIIVGTALILNHQGQNVMVDILGILLVVGGAWNQG